VNLVFALRLQTHLRIHAAPDQQVAREVRHLDRFLVADLVRRNRAAARSHQ
jgi:hypothetical protein